MMMKRLSVLLTNDDGVEAPGLRAFHAALSTRFEVTVLAPLEEQSGVGHAVSLRAPIAHRPLAGWLDMRGMALAGTPADCVKCAVAGLLAFRPDIVVAGINDGENTGVAIYNSGTVAAAREAAIHGIPGFAVSIVKEAAGQLADHAELAASIIEDILGLSDHTKGTYYNLNLPARAANSCLGVRVTRQGLAAYADEWEHGAIEEGRPSVRLRSGYRIAEPELDFDSAAVAAGWVSLTPLTIDSTDAILRTRLGEAFSARRFHASRI
jgi:5'-nucleotidase